MSTPNKRPGSPGPSPSKKPGLSKEEPELASGSAATRGRGGFGQIELRTIPEGITDTKAPPDSVGVKCQVLTNFIKIEPMQNCIINKYRVDFEPDVESITIRRQLFRLATKDLFPNKVTYDGTSDAKSKHLVPKKETELQVDDPQEPETKVTIKIKNTGTVAWGSYELLKTYNMNMKEHLRKLGFYAVSKNGAYVHPLLSRQINPEIMSVGGYRTAANVHQNGVMLMNFEAVQKLMQKKNVLQYMSDIKKLVGADRARTAMIGKLVVTSYNLIVYRVEDVSFQVHPTDTFHNRRDNKDVSYKEYMTNRYQKQVTDDKQPMLLVTRNDRRSDAQQGADEPPIYLIPEFCNIAGLTAEQSEEGKLRRTLIEASQIPPAGRIDDLKKFLTKLNGNDEVKKKLQEWGYSYGKDPLLVEARRLVEVQIGAGEKAKEKPDAWPKITDEREFGNLINNAKCAVLPEFGKLGIIFGSKTARYGNEIMTKLNSGFNRIGASPNKPEIKYLDGDRPNQYVVALRTIPSNITAAIVVMEKPDKEVYDAIKKQASVEQGLITQVITSQVMTNTNKSGGASMKIGLQIAAKLGGEPWYVRIPMTTLMVCGYDTYHDTTNRGRSFGAFTASQNSTFSKWFSKADSHDRLDELSSHMTENLMIALRRYKEVNDGKFPESVIIYRDGVGDGQLEHVFNIEVKQIKKAIEACDKDIKLTFIVVNKRIGARFYLKQGNSYSNPQPGTVIDDVVTRQERYDFYLISQTARKGTVTPTYYNVLHDESKLSADKIQTISYRMCLLYYNWIGGVRVPAPCQYAHKLAKLCGENLHAIPHTRLNNYLHYL